MFITAVGLTNLLRTLFYGKRRTKSIPQNIEKMQAQKQRENGDLLQLLVRPIDVKKCPPIQKGECYNQKQKQTG